MTDQLYRGSKPVMWSVGREDRAGRSRGRVPREDLADDLGEVPDHATRSTATSQALPSSSGRRRRGRSRPTAPSPSARSSNTASTASREAPADNWAKVGDRFVHRRQARRRRVRGRPRRRPTSGVKDVLPVMIARCRAPLPRARRAPNGYWDFDVPVLPGRLCDGGCRHGLRPYRAGPRRRRLQHLRQAPGGVRGLRHAGGAAHGLAEIRPTSRTCRSSPASASTTTRARTAAPTRRSSGSSPKPARSSRAAA